MFTYHEFTYHWMAIKRDTGAVTEGTNKVYLPSLEALYRQLNEWNRWNGWRWNPIIWKYWY